MGIDCSWRGESLGALANGVGVLTSIKFPLSRLDVPRDPGRTGASRITGLIIARLYASPSYFCPDFHPRMRRASGLYRAIAYYRRNPFRSGSRLACVSSREIRA